MVLSLYCPSPRSRDALTCRSVDRIFSHRYLEFARPAGLVGWVAGQGGVVDAGGSRDVIVGGTSGRALGCACRMMRGGGAGVADLSTLRGRPRDVSSPGS